MEDDPIFSVNIDTDQNDSDTNSKEINEQNADNQLTADENVPLKTEDSPIIVLKNLDIFQKKLLILSKLNISIKKGEYVYLIGKTGSGKSSILKVLFADIPAKADEATCVGFDLIKIKAKKIPYLRRKMGIIFQDYQLLSDKTVIENLLFALRASGWRDKTKMLDKAEEVLTMVGLETKDFKYPHQLSGGEQQRVCIARALLNSPEVILADEPTGNLDPITAEEIFTILHEINKKGTTVVMATHNFPLINKFASRTICIEDGKIIDSLL